MKRAELPAGLFSTSLNTSRYPLGATTLLPALLDGRAFRRDPLAFLQSLREDAPVFRFRAGFSEYAVVNEPELIQRVLIDENDRFGEGKWTQRAHYVLGDCLITREADPHRDRRALLQPSFARAHIQAGAPAIVASVERLEARWRHGETRDLRREMARVALIAAARTLYEEDLEDEADEILDAIAVLLRAVSRVPLRRPRLVAARQRVDRLAARINRGPMVVAMREAGLPADRVRDEVISMLFASVDTTPNTLMWAWLEIGRQREVEAGLHAELAEALGGRTPGAGDVSRLATLKRVVSETLRLHPPVHFIDRRALEDVDFGGTRLRAGEYVLLSPLLTQRDARFHEAPLAFRPERFEPDARARWPRFAYFPFGAGPHVCIGMGLAELEITLVVATLAQRWRLVPDASIPADPGLYPARMPMRLERRR